jgi:hypothetical protein
MVPNAGIVSHENQEERIIESVNNTDSVYKRGFFGGSNKPPPKAVIKFP